MILSSGHINTPAAIKLKSICNPETSGFMAAEQHHSLFPPKRGGVQRGNGLKLHRGKLRMATGKLFSNRAVGHWHSCLGKDRVIIPGGVKNHGDVAPRDAVSGHRWVGDLRGFFPTLVILW